MHSCQALPRRIADESFDQARVRYHGHLTRAEGIRQMLRQCRRLGPPGLLVVRGVLSTKHVAVHVKMIQHLRQISSDQVCTDAQPLRVQAELAADDRALLAGALRQINLRDLALCSLGDDLSEAVKRGRIGRDPRASDVNRGALRLAIIAQ